jgi:uncharacterized membrane protein YsdA (DUF1294 family)
MVWTDARFWAAAWVLVLSIISFVLMGLDKRRSKIHGARRIAERTFFTLALLGGSPGAIAGMRHFRPKTRHWYFRWGLPAILLLQLALLIWLIVITR